MSVCFPFVGGPIPRGKSLITLQLIGDEALNEGSHGYGGLLAS